ncbi:MAG: UDP-2,3-diacylglucosamine diphosphatase [Bacteroidales bacterium]|nr:UDP-2,3-diacylglucosamine diphosphatase [Bacteroidales bacterium]
MAERTLVYFVSDVHLGLDVNDPADRESRFVKFLNSIPKDRTMALFMLGDIWDFWYEYRDVVPKGYVRVFASLMDLMDAGVKVYFFQGNHDIWCYHYFESMGIEILQQPFPLEIGGKVFCLGHGDGLGPGHFWYKVMRWAFRNKVCQWLFSTFLHPTVAFRIGTGWSKKSRVARNEEYVFRGEDEPLYKFAVDFSKEVHVDYFIFGHFHTSVDMALPGGGRLLVLKDWMQPQSSNWIVFDLTSGCLGISQNIE